MRTVASQKIEFGSGRIAVRQLTLGSEQPGSQGWIDNPHLSMLRVGFLEQSLVAERWIARLQMGSIGELGPIDLPFIINATQPVKMTVQPLTAPTNAIVVLAELTDLQGATVENDATYQPTLDVNSQASIGTWVKSITTLGGTAIYLDASGNVLGTAFGSRVARPRFASQIQVVGLGAQVLYHY